MLEHVDVVVLVHFLLTVPTEVVEGRGREINFSLFGSLPAPGPLPSLCNARHACPIKTMCLFVRVYVCAIGKDHLIVSMAVYF